MMAKKCHESLEMPVIRVISSVDSNAICTCMGVDIFRDITRYLGKENSALHIHSELKEEKWKGYIDLILPPPPGFQNIRPPILMLYITEQTCKQVKLKYFSGV